MGQGWGGQVGRGMRETEGRAEETRFGKAAKNRAQMPPLESELPRLPGMLGLAGNQSPGWQKWVDSGTRIQRGSQRRDRRREVQEGGGGGFSESYKLETERMSGHLHFLPLLIGIISLAPSFLEGNFK